MAIFSPSNPGKKDAAPAVSDTPSFAARDAGPAAPPANTDFAPATFPRGNAAPQPAAAAAVAPAAKESLIAADLTIEGKIEGSGHVRIAGRFKGDVNVQGDLSLERGAKLNGGVRANKVVLAGELEGNVESAARVELLDTSVVIGDLKAGTLTVAAGAKIRGHIDCGWDDGSSRKPAKAAGARDSGGASDTGAKAEPTPAP